MTRKNGLERVNHVILENKEQWYSDEELLILRSLGILCEEILWSWESEEDRLKTCPNNQGK